MPDLSSRALTAKGRLEFEAGADAVETLGKALEKDRRNIIAWHLKGKAHLRNRQFKQAEACLDTALGLDKNYVWAWLEKVKLYRERGAQKKALECVDIALSIDPDFKEALELKRVFSS